ncbi:GATOR complex protein NPRL2, partial [Eurytemora carolleeae]|uniref:GATOR complex protein NPRL2 n=1 Tax=Eurytemora carolleeae TaxID=1294199 RepID=UPI000C7796C3
IDEKIFQILPNIDGFNSVARLAPLADVEVNSVRACIQNLVYHQVVELVPIFLYSNVYTITPEWSELCRNQDFRDKIQEFNILDAPVLLQDLIRFISSFTYGTTVKDICSRMNPGKLGFDERRLIQFLVLKGALRRVHKYPVYQGENECTESLYSWFTGEFSTDHISIKTGLSSQDLDFRIEADPNIVCLWK